jgi:hypothetical protein
MPRLRSNLKERVRWSVTGRAAIGRMRGVHGGRRCVERWAQALQGGMRVGQERNARDAMPLWRIDGKRRGGAGGWQRSSTKAANSLDTAFPESPDVRMCAASTLNPPIFSKRFLAGLPRVEPGEIQVTGAGNEGDAEPLCEKPVPEMRNVAPDSTRELMQRPPGSPESVRVFRRGASRGDGGNLPEGRGGRERHETRGIKGWGWRISHCVRRERASWAQIPRWGGLGPEGTPVDELEWKGRREGARRHRRANAPKTALPFPRRPRGPAWYGIRAPWANRIAKRRSVPAARANSTGG